MWYKGLTPAGFYIKRILATKKTHLTSLEDLITLSHHGAGGLYRLYRLYRYYT
jgi:hypothetical protein